MHRHYRVNELAEMLGIGVSTVWHWTKIGRLPKPVKLAPRVTVWREEDVLEAIERIAHEQEAADV